MKTFFTLVFILCVLLAFTIAISGCIRFRTPTTDVEVNIPVSTTQPLLH